MVTRSDWLSGFNRLANRAQIARGLLLTCLVFGSDLSWATQTLRVGLYQNLPKVGLSEHGKPEGIYVDTIQAIADAEGWRIEYVPGTWQEGLTALEQGQIDLMSDVALTTEREDIYAFHQEPVLSSWNQIYARRGDNIRSLPDLDGKKVAVLAGSVQEIEYRQMIAGFGLRGEPVPQPDYEVAFKAVSEGLADAVITNRFYGLRHAAAAGLEDTAIAFSPTKLYFAARRDIDPAVLATIDRHLRTLKQDPDSTYFRSLQHWIGESSPVVIPAWLPYALGGGLLALLASAAWVSLLRRQVAARTRILQHKNQENARLYEAVRTHADELEIRVAQRTQDLLESNHELEQAKVAAEAADRLKSAFLATMSHELRTPLNSIIGFTGVILQELAGPLNPEQHKQLGMVRQSARHLLALINDVLDISKIEAGELTLASDRFKLADSVRKVEALTRPLAEKKGLTLSVQMADELVDMVGDQRRVEQILLNLLGNAVKFTESGSIQLTVDPLMDAPPGSNAQVERPAVRFQVSDTGIGIKPDDVDSLFRAFRQIDSNLSRQHDGTGLGLAICRNLVTMMEGSIGVESQWGQGSRFTVTLPLATAGGCAAASVPAQAAG